MSKKLKVIENCDKKNHESWDSPQDRKLANFPHPYRCLIAGPPNSGKSTIILNLLVAAQPMYDNLFIIHPQTFEPNISEESERINKDILVPECKIDEYSGVEWTGSLRYFPSPTYFDDIAKKKNLLVIDDVELKNYIKGKPYRASRINKLFSYTSTHRSLTIIIACQDIYSQLTPAIYRLCNVFILFKFKDANQVSLIGRNIGMKKEKLQSLMKLLKAKHDSVCIDNTDDTPAPYRFNVLNPIHFEKEEF